MSKKISDFNNQSLSGITGTAAGKIHLDTKYQAIYLDTVTDLSSAAVDGRKCFFRGSGWPNSEYNKFFYINSNGEFATCDYLNVIEDTNYKIIQPTTTTVNLGTSNKLFKYIYTENIYATTIGAPANKISNIYVSTIGSLNDKVSSMHINNIYADDYHLEENDIPDLSADKITGGTITGNITVNGRISTATADGGLELIGSTPYVDFHCNSNTNVDHSARIICEENNKLSIVASSGLDLNGPLTISGENSFYTYYIGGREEGKQIHRIYAENIGSSVCKVTQIYATDIGTNNYKISNIYATNYHLAAEDIPDLSASKITGGTMSSSRIKNSVDGTSAFNYLGVGIVANTQDRFRVGSGKSYFEGTVHIAGKNNSEVAQLTIGRDSHFSGFNNSNTARVYIDNTNGTYTYDFYLNGTAVINGVLKVKEPIEIYSDRRLKKNIFNLNNFNNIDKFYDNLIPSIYSFINDEKQYFGFIAQDIKNSLKDLNGDFNIISIPQDLENDFYGLKYEEFIALNTDQIQKLKKRVTEQDEQIKELQHQINLLRLRFPG